MPDMKYYIEGEKVNQWLCVTMRITANGALAGDGNILNLNYGMAA